MQKTGLVILAIDIVSIIFRGFKYITREKVVDIGEVQITRDKENTVAWSPFVGLVVMVVGGGILLFGAKK